MKYADPRIGFFDALAARWDDEELSALKGISAGDFEMIQLGYASEPSTSGDTQVPSAPKNLKGR